MLLLYCCCTAVWKVPLFSDCCRYKQYSGSIRQTTAVYIRLIIGVLRSIYEYIGRYILHVCVYDTDYSSIPCLVFGARLLSSFFVFLVCVGSVPTLAEWWAGSQCANVPWVLLLFHCCVLYSTTYEVCTLKYITAAGALHFNYSSSSMLIAGVQAFLFPGVISLSVCYVCMHIYYTRVYIRSVIYCCTYIYTYEMYKSISQRCRQTCTICG